MADTAKMIETLQKLREAPVVSEDYRGPVCFPRTPPTTFSTDDRAQRAGHPAEAGRCGTHGRASFIQLQRTRAAGFSFRG